MTDPPDASETGAFQRLRRMARAGTSSAEEHCDLCGEALPVEHRHLFDITSRDLLCACRACVILFDRQAAGGGRRRLVPTRRLYLADFSMTDAQWDGLHLPVNMVFFSCSTAAERVVAIYPSPAGPTESLLTLETWEELERRNPILATMESDVEALLVNRTHQGRDYFLVPIDECYRLVGLIRLHWHGLSGGPRVRQEIDEFFSGLRGRSQMVGGAHA